MPHVLDLIIHSTTSIPSLSAFNSLCAMCFFVFRAENLFVFWVVWKKSTGHSLPAVTHAFFFLFLYFHNRTFPCVNTNLLISSAYFQMCRDAQNQHCHPAVWSDQFGHIADCTIFITFYFCGWTQRVFKKDGLIGDKVRTKEVICKLIVPNQFVALASINTKGYGPEGFGQMGWRKSPASTFDNGARRRLFNIVTAEGEWLPTLWPITCVIMPKYTVVKHQAAEQRPCAHTLTLTHCKRSPDQPSSKWSLLAQGLKCITTLIQSFTGGLYK